MRLAFATFLKRWVQGPARDFRKFVAAGRRNQHARRARYPEHCATPVCNRPIAKALTLKTAAAAIQFLTPATRGLALRYGIFVRSDCWGDRALVAHELAHTAQYERLGGIQAFLRQYLTECLTVGYPEGPMEQEAIAAVSRLQSGDFA
jgi:hypothetical protein